eukprot:20906-Amphidinium_carterae.1
MLALVDPANYPTSTKSLRKMSDEAAVNRKNWYTFFVEEDFYAGDLEEALDGTSYTRSGRSSKSGCDFQMAFNNE